MECSKSANAEKCTCTYTSCARRGACCQCIEYHRSRNEMVACYFTAEVEKTYDRSMKAFLNQFK